ncbi:MAG: hypothetical protein AB7I57_15190 [Pirellulales bacterium]
MRLPVFRSCSLCLLAALAVVGVIAVDAFAQAPSSREFAPGVLTTIAPDFEPGETVSTHDIVEVRANNDAKWQPELMTESRTLYGMAEGVKFRRDVSCLEFSFKPLRMIRVPVAGPNGTVEEKLVWYMVYAVRNTGEVMKPVEGKDGVFTTEMGKGGPLRFVPSFVLESHDLTADGQPIEKAYLDRILPAAIAQIRARETRGQTLLNSAEMAQQVLPPSDGRTDNRVWGVATWTDVDPRIDFFSVYVGGLTNAYQWEDPAGAFKAGDKPGTGREFARKTLQLNFWRPGDEHLQDEREVRFGVARGKGGLYNVSEGVAYRWVYR